MRFVQWFFWLPALLLLGGCATQPGPVMPTPLVMPGTVDTANAQTDTPPPEQAAPLRRVERMPRAPQASVAPSPVISDALPLEARDDIAINFEQVPLPTLIQVVYAEILGRTVTLDAGIRDRRDLVTFRTPPQQSSRQVHEAMKVLLGQYGLSVVDSGALVRITTDTERARELPVIRRGAALPESPESLRPVFQLIELEAVRNNEVAGWIRNMFGNRVNIAEDAGRNAIILSGTNENVIAAIQAIRMLDQPVMHGRSSLRIDPAYWSAEELSARLQDILAAEGYTMPPANFNVRGGGIRYPILLLPLPASNSLLVFSRSEDILGHIRRWVNELDRPQQQAGKDGFHTYVVRNTTAESLADTINQLLSGTRSTTEGDSAGRGDRGRVVVDRASNTLIIQADADEYGRLLGLLRNLDRPSRSALIEVTIAEVTLSNDQKLGVEWLIEELNNKGAGVVIGTLNGLSIGSAGLTITQLASGGDTRLILNALATSNRATILSSPRIMARNGETATIQVGQDVPIITSQQSSTEGTGILQTVQYRQTGVILNVTPVIHSGNRVDLDVKQEVSAVQTTLTGVNNSPTIATRNVETRLTLQHGSTVMLGGLISDDRSEGTAGVPGLKNLPLFGRLFRSDSQESKKTELIALITPYIIGDDDEALAVTEAFKSMLPWLESMEVTPSVSEP
ncbi:secretin N-terminal domain-containing protein [Ectothiorhodospira lacustris]|uniref:secretin N-terminal domain-containing protein n=1 Tax=Ectothiorhodospira lacustris TaxID=2899127 RepID=UPI001EE78DC7|nr:secretin N-terminal domain-containing protein [Ectothiorhodospira lacustris]MCG5500809.1 hypothetical protein [Ectothiorhodospira lacustris]